jgi:hypothetical protein
MLLIPQPFDDQQAGAARDDDGQFPAFEAFYQRPLKLV